MEHDTPTVGRPDRAPAGFFSSPIAWKDSQSWSRGFIAFQLIEQETGYDIWIVPDDDPEAGRAYVATLAEELFPQISPDGRWLAYASNESGRFQIYVQSFPEPGAKFQATTEGGTGPIWSDDGTELFCETSDGALSAIPVTQGKGLTFGAPRQLFPLGRMGIEALDVAPGGRFAAIVPRDPEAQTLIVVFNWAEELKR